MFLPINTDAPIYYRPIGTIGLIAIIECVERRPRTIGPGAAHGRSVLARGRKARWRRRAKSWTTQRSL